MAGLTGSGGLVQVDVDQPRSEGGKGEPGGGGQRAGSEDGQAHVGEGEKRFRQSAQIARFTGEADDLVDVRPGFSELDQKTFQPQRGEFPPEGVGGEDQVPLGTADGAQDPAQARQIRQFEIDDIGKREEGEEEKHPLAGAPVESSTFFAGTQGQENRQLFFGHGAEDFFRVHPFGEKKIQADFHQVDPRGRVGEVPQTAFRRNRADG